jgi:hypothetical protein
MTQSTVLAAGTTADASTDIVVAAGSVVTVGIFAATAADLPIEAIFDVMQDTPGADNVAARLHQANRTTVLSGPGTFRVKRPAYTGSAFGVFVET